MSDAGGTPVAPLAGVIDCTTGGGLGATKVCPLLQAPKVWTALVRQPKAAEPVPLPPSCSEVLTGVASDSDTASAMLVRPAAGPLLARMPPS